MSKMFVKRKFWRKKLQKNTDMMENERMYIQAHSDDQP